MSKGRMRLSILRLTISLCKVAEMGQLHDYR